jgi:hypothetical protein
MTEKKLTQEARVKNLEEAFLKMLGEFNKHVATPDAHNPATLATARGKKKTE